MERIYIISYKFYHVNNGMFKFAENPKFENRIIYFQKEERDKFIECYKDLIKPEKDLYVDNIECYTSIPEKINDMKKIINAI
jgi:hypothetical protein